MEKIDNIQETLLRIRKEAERRVAESRYEKSKPPKLVIPSVKLAKAAVAPAAPAKDELPVVTPGLINLLSKKAARDFVDEAVETIRSCSMRSIRENTDDKLTNAFQEKGKVTFYPKNCKLLVSNKKNGCVVIEEEPQYRTIF